MIRILVDSSSDYSLEEIREKNFEFVPIHITVGESSYIEGQNLERSQFYDILQQSSDFPKTSQPSPQAFLDLFLDAKEKGDEMICILLSSELSGTFQSAILAKNMADYDKIYLIDSRSATYVIKIMADYALSLVESGLSAAEIAARTDSLKSRVKVLAVLDTLEYLYRGGRISRATAAIGEMAHIKPLITLTEEGKIAVPGKGIGKNRAISACLSLLQKQNLDDSFPVYSIYSFGTENCEKFECRLRENGISVTSRLQIGPTIGTHIGPQAFGIVYVTKPSTQSGA